MEGTGGSEEICGGLSGTGDLRRSRGSLRFGGLSESEGLGGSGHLRIFGWCKRNWGAEEILRLCGDFGGF